jgi:hypothetical protein
VIYVWIATPGGNVTAPDGTWTEQVDQNVAAGTSRLYCFTKTAGGSEGATYTFTNGTSESYAWVSNAAAGGSGSVQVLGSQTVASGSTSYATPAGTPFADGTLVVAGYVSNDNQDERPITADSSPAATIDATAFQAGDSLHMSVQRYVQTSAASVSLDFGLNLASNVTVGTGAIALMPEGVLLIPVAASGDDGYVEQWSTAYAGSDGTFSADLTTDAMTVRNSQPGFGGSNQFARSNFIARFLTDAIPDAATITAATLQIKSNANLTNVNSRNLQIEWIADPGTITTADYNATPAATAKAATALSGLAASTAYAWALLAPAANISKVAATGLRFHIDGGSPTGNNQIGFHTYDHATEPAPVLMVTYTTGLTPPYVSVSIA